MEGNAPADADGRTLAPRLELRREVDNPVVVTRDPRGTARGTAMDRTAGDIPERVVPNKSGDIATSGDLKTQDSPDILQPTTTLELIDRVFPSELRGVVFFILASAASQFRSRRGCRADPSRERLEDGSIGIVVRGRRGSVRERGSSPGRPWGRKDRHARPSELVGFGENGTRPVDVGRELGARWTARSSASGPRGPCPSPRGCATRTLRANGGFRGSWTRSGTSS